MRGLQNNLENQTRVGQCLHNSGFTLADNATFAMLYADLIERTELPEKRERYLTVIRRSGERMLYFAQSLMVLGSLAYEIHDSKPNNLEESYPDLLDNAIEQMKEHIALHRIEMIIEIEPCLQEAVLLSRIPPNFFSYLVCVAIVIAPEGSNVEISIKKSFEDSQGFIQITFLTAKKGTKIDLTEDPFVDFASSCRRWQHHLVSGFELLFLYLYTVRAGGETKYCIEDERIRFDFRFPVESILGEGSD